MDADRRAPDPEVPRDGPTDPAALNRAAYDRIADAYAGRADGRATRFFGPMRDRFAASLDPGATVLDVGCGPGHLLPWFAERGLRPVGVDPSAGMAAIARATGSPVVRADMTALPLADGCADAVWCQAALLHVPAAATAGVLRGFARALRPGGALGLVTAVGDDEPAGERLEEVDYAPGVHRWFVYRDRVRLLRQVADAGFQVGQTERLAGRRPWFALVASLADRPTR